MPQKLLTSGSIRTSLESETRQQKHWKSWLRVAIVQSLSVEIHFAIELRENCSRRHDSARGALPRILRTRGRRWDVRELQRKNNCLLRGNCLTLNSRIARRQRPANQPRNIVCSAENFSMRVNVAHFSSQPLCSRCHIEEPMMRIVIKWTHFLPRVNLCVGVIFRVTFRCTLRLLYFLMRNN